MPVLSQTGAVPEQTADPADLYVEAARALGLWDLLHPHVHRLAQVREHVHLGEPMRPAQPARRPLGVQRLHDDTALLIPLPPRGATLEEEALHHRRHERLCPVLTPPALGRHHE
jgi:hypothetical protein